MKFFKWRNYRLGIDLRKLTTGIIGFGSVCENGEHCLFYDLDNISEQQLRGGILAIQKAYDLGSCYVFRTSKSSYHAVFLDKLSRGMVINLHDHFRNITPNWDGEGLINHDISSLRRQYWTLRLSGRGYDHIIHLFTLPSTSKYWRKSNAHRLALQKLHGLTIRKTKDFDDYIGVVYDNYSAKKKLLK